jgi:hypothetical protein
MSYNLIEKLTERSTTTVMSTNRALLPESKKGGDDTYVVQSCSRNLNFGWRRRFLNMGP